MGTEGLLCETGSWVSSLWPAEEPCTLMGQASQRECPPHQAPFLSRISLANQAQAWCLGLSCPILTLSNRSPVPTIPMKCPAPGIRDMVLTKTTWLLHSASCVGLP